MDQKMTGAKKSWNAKKSVSLCKSTRQRNFQIHSYWAIIFKAVFLNFKLLTLLHFCDFFSETWRNNSWGHIISWNDCLRLNFYVQVCASLPLAPSLHTQFLGWKSLKHAIAFVYMTEKALSSVFLCRFQNQSKVDKNWVRKYFKNC